MPKAKSKTKAIIPGRRLALFGRPLLLPGEDSAAYDGLFAGVHAAVKPVDALEEMLVADVVALEWQVLRWRRLKLSLLRACQCAALEHFLRDHIDYDLYAEDFADELATILKDNLPQDQADTAEQLAQACGRDDADAVNKVEEILELNQLSVLKIGDIWDRARVGKAAELAKKYVRRKPEAVALADELLAGANVTIDDLMVHHLGSRIDKIEQIDRLATIAESRRNTSLREIDRRRAVLGESLRRSFREVEDAEFQVVETTPTKGQIAP